MPGHAALPLPAVQPRRQAGAEAQPGHAGPASAGAGAAYARPCRATGDTPLTPKIGPWRDFSPLPYLPSPRPRKRACGPACGPWRYSAAFPSTSSPPRDAAPAPQFTYLASEGRNGRAVWPVLPARRPKAGRLAGVVLAPACGGTLSTVAAKPRARTRASFVKPFVKTFVGDFVTGRKASAGAGFSRFWKIERWQFSERKVAVFRAKVAVFRAESTR